MGTLGERQQVLRVMLDIVPDYDIGDCTVCSCCRRDGG
jgi:multimeric flavodoxin WrbA